VRQLSAFPDPGTTQPSSRQLPTRMVVVALRDRFHAGRTIIAAAGGLVATARLMYAWELFRKKPEGHAG